MEKTTENSKNDINTINNIDELATLKKNYLVLKRKVCRTDELIRQYNDKVKECERLKTELDSAHTEIKTLKTNYNGALGKIIKLELSNTDYAKQITSLSSTIETQETKIAGDQQHLHQLSYKLKEVEDKHVDERLKWEMMKTVLKDKVKELEHALKITKKSKVSRKKVNKPEGIEKGTNCCFENLIPRVDVAVNTIDDNINIRTDKSSMTDLSFDAKSDNIYPLFCDNCDILLSDPINAICKTMTKSPKMIESILSFSDLNCKDRNNDKRVSFQNQSENESMYSNNSLELSKMSSSFLQKSHVVREEPLANLEQQTTTETITHYMDELRELRNQMKKLDKKVKKQSHKKKPPDYNYFQTPQYGNYFRNETLFNYNSMLNLMSRVLNKLNNLSDTKCRSNKIRKRKRESQGCKHVSKTMKRRRLQQNLSTSNNVWKVDSIVPCLRTDNSTSNENLNKLPSFINSDLLSDNDTNPDRNNIIETANDNLLKSNGSNDKHCFNSTLIEETQPVRDTQSILESLNLNNFSQHKIIIITSNNTINDLNPNTSTESILRTSISAIDEYNMSDIKTKINIPFTKESDNTENMIENMSTSIDKDQIQVNASDSTSNVAPNVTIIKNRKRKLELSERNSNQSNLIKDSLILKKNNKDIENVESNPKSIIENTRENISEKVMNNESNVQIVNPDIVLKKKQRMIHEVKTNSQEVSKLPNENLNLIPETNDESIGAEQSNTLDCTSLNEKETEYIEKKNVSKKKFSIDKKKTFRSKCGFPLNTNRTRLLKTINNLQPRPLMKISSLQLFDTDEPINEENKDIEQKKCIPKGIERKKCIFNLAHKQNNKTKKCFKMRRSISKSKAKDKDRIEKFSEGSFNDLTNVKLTDKSELLTENVVMTGVSSITTSTDINDKVEGVRSIDINDKVEGLCSTDINESIEDERSPAAMTALKDSKLMEEKETFINTDAEVKRKNIESCHETNEENEMIETVCSDSFPFKLISPIKEKYISKDICENSLKKEINVSTQDVPLNSQILNLNEIDSECTIESPVKELETTTFVKEVTTEKIITKNTKKTKEFHLQSKSIDINIENINEISEEKEDKMIVNAEEQLNSATINKEKSSKLSNPLKDNPISSDICESSLENKFDKPIQNVEIHSQRLIARGLGALIDSKHAVGLKKKVQKTNIPNKSKLEVELNKKEKDSSTNGICENIKVHENISTESTNTIMPIENLNIQSHNAIVHDLKVTSANSRTDTEQTNNDNLATLFNPVVFLKSHLNTNLHIGGLKKPSRNLEILIKKTDKFVHKQLNKIVNNTDWTMSIHKDVVDKLSSTCSVRIIAKGVVDFMLTKRNNNLDKTYTPPAPVMTKDQQKIVALLIDLEVKMPTLIKWVQAGIEFKIFRLNYAPTFPQIESLIRLYIVLTRIKKDTEKLRMLCCDALYCLGVCAIPIIYTVFTCSSEVFPKFTENTDMLPKCIVHCIMSLQIRDLPQLSSLRKLLSIYYNYKNECYLTKNLAKELLRCFERSHFNENTVSLKTAIILLAKKEGVSWTYDNIIKNILLPNIVGRKYASMHDVFVLLGNLMRSFPLEDTDGIIKRTIEQLVDLLNSGKGSHDQQEGIASALLSLSRHDLFTVINTVMKWEPSEPLRITTINQFSAFFSHKTKGFWKKYLKSVKNNLPK